MSFANFSRCCALAGLAGAAAVSVCTPLRAQTEVALHAFKGHGDGENPVSSLIFDSAGNLYGTTLTGGGGCPENKGCGTVFKLAPDGTETVLHAFAGGKDGAYPRAGLIADAAGNMYGTTSQIPCRRCANGGTVFKITPDGVETVLYVFGSQSGDGAFPEGGLVIDPSGNLYGTTEIGGKYYTGTAFEVTPGGSETILHSFQDAVGIDGGYPRAGLVRDSSGNLYGTTAFGDSGCPGVGCGIVFKLAPDGTETILYAFTGTNGDGYQPVAPLIRDGKGNLYGTTENGGGTGCGNSYYGCGTVFKISHRGKETVLSGFDFPGNPGNPTAGLLMDASGNLYGTTSGGGSCGCGTVFELAPDGTGTTLYDFTSGGYAPDAALTSDQAGNFYGTTYWGYGGANCTDCALHKGVVFELSSSKHRPMMQGFDAVQRVAPSTELR